MVKLAEKKLIEAKEVAETITGKKIEITQKAGVDGRLFGSVTGQDVVNKIKEQGVSIVKSQISFKDGPIKTLGEHSVKILVHSEITVDLLVNVVADSQEINS